MNTTKITIKSHLAEYCIGKWGDDFAEPVRFPPKTDLYITIYDLLQKRPSNVYTDNGNLEIIMPSRMNGDTDGFRKNPEYYNFLSEKSCAIIEKRITSMFWTELHDELMFQKKTNDQNYDITANFFICKYRIESLSTDAILKNFYRWRENFRKREVRKYKRKKTVKL
jgi:hypothetical protein